MSGTVTSSTGLTATVDATGIHVPSFETVLAGIQALYQGIYGSDVIISADTQDGQFLGILASLINDVNATAAAVYNGFSPSTAQGTGLSSVVKINGLQRETPSNSTVDLTLIGQVGRTITGGIVADANNHRWDLPSPTVIGLGGVITVTATCETPGAVAAPTNTVTTIVTQVQGWTSVSNLTAADPGSPVETDAALRARQAASTMIPSVSVYDGINGAIKSLGGVTRTNGDNNTGTSTDANGVPANSLAMVVEGGDATEIASVIAEKITVGAGTAGNTNVTLTDSSGNQRVISFYRPAETTISVGITVHVLTSLYSNAVGNAVASAIANYIQALSIGATIYPQQLYSPGALPMSAGGGCYVIEAITIGTSPNSLGTAPVALAFNAAPVCSVANVTVTISST